MFAKYIEEARKKYCENLEAQCVELFKVAGHDPETSTISTREYLSITKRILIMTDNAGVHTYSILEENGTVVAEFDTFFKDNKFHLTPVRLGG